MSEVTTAEKPSAEPAAVTPRRPRRRWAKGSDRPEYLRPQDLDRMMIMLVALMGEVSALRDRLDTHEALAERGEVISTDAVEGYQLNLERQSAREVRREAMLKRVLRAILEEREAALQNPGPNPERNGDDDHAG